MSDPDLHDPDLLEEIELLGELVIAASASEGELPITRIDAILGIDLGQTGPSSGREDSSNPP